MSTVVPAITAALRAALDGLGAGEVEAVVEPCALPELGDWSTPAALKCAKVLRRPPMEIAAQLREALEAARVPHVAEWTVSQPGYVNARLDAATWAPAVIRDALALDVDAPLQVAVPGAVAGKTLIEHTSINTNKAAHIGHLRNACIGDCVARLLRRTGQRVEVQNYIDDTGVQVADVVVGLQRLGYEPAPGEPFDQFCSRVYVEVMKRYATDPELVEHRREVLQAIEERDNEVAVFAKDLARRIVAAHLATMARFDIDYDLLTWESDIIELGFWRTAFELLREAGVIVLVESGKNAGCWVMPHAEELELPHDEVEGRDVKVLVKSDGVATYTAKDIAYQLWKFGLLGVDFHYRPWDPDDADGHPATTVSAPGEGTLDDRGFGHAHRVITVIDARQSYPQGVVRAALARLGHQLEAERSTHLAYEVVALTPRAAHELGIESEEQGAVALSGRRGIEVRADDLLDRATAKVADKARDAGIAAALAAGAIRYYLLKFTLPVVIAFDFEEALRTTGDSGVYVQYAHARAAGILRKVEDDGGEPVPHGELLPSERTLLMRIDQYAEAVAEAAGGLAPSVLCAYTLSLASALSDVYEHTPPIVRESDPAVRRFRRALVDSTRATLADALGVLGIAALDQI
jgi:arginyl-tRNA synthetase